MTDDKFDDRYVGFREHAAAVQRTDTELARLRERQATTEATLLHEVAGVRSDVQELKQLMLRPPPPQPDHSALATHRAIDALVERLPSGSGSKTSPVLIAFALCGAIALGAFAMNLVGG